MTHLIKKQQLQIKFNGSESDGFAMQKHLMDLYYSKVLLELEKAFDSCVADDSHLIFDRISINLGDFKIDKIDEQFAPAMVKAVLKKIGEELDVKIGEGIGMYGKPLHNNKENKDLPISFTKQEFLLRVFICFLKSGNLPWFYKMPVGKNLEEIASEVLIGIKDLPDIRAIKDELVKLIAEITVRIRLVQQFSEKFNHMFLAWISPEVANKVIEISTITNSGSFTGDESKVFAEALLQTALLSVAQLETATETDLKIQTINYLYNKAEKQIIKHDFLIKVLNAFRFDSKQLEQFEPITRLVRLRPATKLEEIEPTKLLQHFPDGTSNQLLEKFEEDVSNIEGRKAKQRALAKNTDLAMPIENEESENLFSIAESVYGEETVKEGIYIKNAGLVLLHPFLSRFFENLKISDSDILLQPHKALCLLHFLATGQTTMPEYELVLPKILCQMPFTAPVPLRVPLAESELEEANTLLNAVIGHWGALQNTSTEGLRNTFLLRNGKLTKKEDGDWLLQVEMQSFDILLDQLPWGFSMIKLPCMKQMLWVEWRV